jgi:hypothetical protein
MPAWRLYRQSAYGTAIASLALLLPARYCCWCLLVAASDYPKAPLDAGLTAPLLVWCAAHASAVQAVAAYTSRTSTWGGSVMLCVVEVAMSSLFVALLGACGV